MLSDFDLSGQRALVTGAGRGIGKGVALALAEAGAVVGVTALSTENAVKAASDITRISGRHDERNRIRPEQSRHHLRGTNRRLFRVPADASHQRRHRLSGRRSDLE
jgi:NAD(P)-dependent dehydrogenase (short-subunit alcohol dehydrogenase family)